MLGTSTEILCKVVLPNPNGVYQNEMKKHQHIKRVIKLLKKIVGYIVKKFI